MEPARSIVEERLTIVGDELRAEMVRSMLDAHGISCVVRRTALGELQWGAVNVGMGGPREIVVARDDLAAAREALEGADQTLEGDAVDHEPAAIAQQALLRRGFTTFAVLLFGIPLLVGIVGLLASIADGIG